jgi:hypothetical protein
MHAVERPTPRIVAVAIVVAGLLGVAATVSTCRPDERLPARVWIVDGPARQTLGTSADLRASPGGLRVDELGETHLITHLIDTPPGEEPLLFARIPKGPVERVRDLFRAQRRFSLRALPYRRTETTEECDGTLWRAWDRR